MALSPNGHGGSLKALIDSGSVADMAERSRAAFLFSGRQPFGQCRQPAPDRVARPAAFGHVQSLLTKTGPFEKLGNFVSIGDRVTIIEYSDLPEEKALKSDVEGRIKYRAGSPAIQRFSP